MDSVVYRKKLDIVAIARAMGIDSVLVDRPGQIGPAVAAAFAGKRPAVIEVRSDGSISPPLGDRAKTVAGFKGRDSRG